MGAMVPAPLTWPAAATAWVATQVWDALAVELAAGYAQFWNPKGVAAFIVTPERRAASTPACAPNSGTGAGPAPRAHQTAQRLHVRADRPDHRRPALTAG